MQKIIDSHIHFWSPETLRYDWLNEVPSINRPFLPADLLAQQGDYQLEKLIFVQAGAASADALAEVEWVTTLAQDEPRIAAIVADAPLERGASVTAHLETLARNPLVKGVRRLIQSEPDGFCIQPAFIKAVQLLPRYHFSFDICIVHHQLGDVLQLVAQCPNVTFILDHLGKPAIKAGQFEPWATQLAELATFENVWCKLSGLITEADHAGWVSADLRSYIDHALATFGANRLLFGGDWPVSLLASTAWHEWVTTAAAALSPTDQANVFYKNAQTVYRLGATTP